MTIVGCITIIVFSRDVAIVDRLSIFAVNSADVELETDIKLSENHFQSN